MPWKKFSQSANMKIYKEILGDVIRDNKDMDLTFMGMLIRTELLKNNFTKRQINIIAFIVTFSFAYGKGAAYIPNYAKSFEIAGISHKKVKNELDKLISMDVISWNREESLFSINDPQSWKVPHNQGYDEYHLRQLFMQNLEHFGIDVTPITKKLHKDI